MKNIRDFAVLDVEMYNVARNNDRHSCYFLSALWFFGILFLLFKESCHYNLAHYPLVFSS